MAQSQTIREAARRQPRKFKSTKSASIAKGQPRKFKSFGQRSNPYWKSQTILDKAYRKHVINIGVADLSPSGLHPQKARTKYFEDLEATLRRRWETVEKHEAQEDEFEFQMAAIEWLKTPQFFRFYGKPAPEGIFHGTLCGRARRTKLLDMWIGMGKKSSTFPF